LIDSLLNDLPGLLGRLGHLDALNGLSSVGGLHLIELALIVDGDGDVDGIGFLVSDAITEKRRNEDEAFSERESGRSRAGEKGRGSTHDPTHSRARAT